MKTIYWIPICIGLVCVTGVTSYMIASRPDTDKPGTVIARISDADLQANASQPSAPQLATQQGMLRGSLTYTGVENLLTDACMKSKWRVVNKGKNFMTINFDHKGINFDATLRFTNSKYSIVYKKMNQDRGDRVKAYAVYKKYVDKLNKTIQKAVYKGRY